MEASSRSSGSCKLFLKWKFADNVGKLKQKNAKRNLFFSTINFTLRVSLVNHSLFTLF